MTILTTYKKSSKSQAVVTNGPVFVQKVIGNDTWLVMAQSKVELEDEFGGLYYTSNNYSNIFLQPPFDPKTLLNFVVTNSVLSQCVEAMEVNIDGTGHEFQPKNPEKKSSKKLKPPKPYVPPPSKEVQLIAPDGNTDMDTGTGNPKTELEDQEAQDEHDKAKAKQIFIEKTTAEEEQKEYEEQVVLQASIDKEISKASAFFKEPYPGVSFITMRRKLRRQIESIGYSFLEILRNMEGKVVGLRNVETHNIRMVKLDAPILVKKTVMREGQEVELHIWERQRRFAQRVALKQMVYYREYGTARQVDRFTGQWEISAVEAQASAKTSTPQTQYEVPVANRGTELLMLGVHPDVTTPYFLPRWINELPSVIGGRKAEELNLEFLDAGGMPPAIVFVNGGTIAKDTADQLRMYLSGQNKNKNRAVVVEAISSAGNIDKTSAVKVTVERFGAASVQDSMFQNYGTECEERVRIGFRIPPLFLGKAADYNFATAQTSYIVAEQQVFKPERMEFDEIINTTIGREFEWESIKFVSLPMSMVNVDNQINMLTVAKDVATPESFMDEVNKIGVLDLEINDNPVDPQEGISGAPVIGQPAIPHPMPKGPPNLKLVKSARQLVDLATDYAAMRGLTRKQDMSDTRKQELLKEVDALNREDSLMFNTLLASMTYGQANPDLVSIASHSH